MAKIGATSLNLYLESKGILLTVCYNRHWSNPRQIWWLRSVCVCCWDRRRLWRPCPHQSAPNKVTHERSDEGTPPDSESRNNEVKMWADVSAKVMVTSYAARGINKTEKKNKTMRCALGPCVWELFCFLGQRCGLEQVSLFPFLFSVSFSFQIQLSTFNLNLVF